MSIATLISKLKTKRQAAHRTSFQAYLATVKELASGGEIDADEVAAILDSVGRSEDDLEKDVRLQQQRLSWHAQRVQNQQAVLDRQQAERDFLAAQRALQEAYDRLQPAIESARSRMQVAEQATLSTMSAEARLSELVLDAELLERERAVNVALREIQAELQPLLKDRDFKRHSLANAEYNLNKLQARKEGDWVPAGIVEFFNQPLDIRVLKERIADLKTQVAQLNAAIQPRQQEQQRLQAELDAIHSEKLKP